MFELIQEVIYKVTGKTNITYETDFVKDLELSSFDIMNIICEFSLFAIALIANLVVCGLFAVIDTSSFIRLFNNVDFPTFVLPIIDTNPDLNSAIFSPFIDLLLF